MTNLEIGELLRKIAAAYQILGENRFKIIAYERAADSIEHLTSEIKDLWDDGKLDEIPGVGATLVKHLDELFRTGKVEHFDQILGKLPQSVYPLLKVPGIGPKKAYKLVTQLNLASAETVIDDLAAAALSHKIAGFEGFGEKSEADILAGIELFKKGSVKQNRMVLPEADSIVQELIGYLQKGPKLARVDVLGSLRRGVSTIGDIDIAVQTENPEPVIENFVKFPHQKIIEKGPAGASLLLTNGHQVDMRVQTSKAYGAMLQYFTGSKNHNIKLRSYALEKGFSLSEYGIKNVKTGKLTQVADEIDFYKTIGLKWIPPELREDRGEIEADRKNLLPDLVALADIKGDLHIHTSYDLKPSHDLGSNTLEEYLSMADSLSYEYIAISDHNPSTGDHDSQQICDIMKRRKDYYDQIYYSYTKSTHGVKKLFIMLEVDIQPDGELALPDKAFQYVDAVIVSVHSSFQQDRDAMTKRVIKALTANPKVRIMGHPTGRLLGRREGYELDWPEIFSVVKKHNIALEINAHPMRLDLPDALVFDAVKNRIPLCIDTDSHDTSSMSLMKYGVTVARRGWATKNDIINTLGYNEFTRWLLKGELL
jgi:DNA polymerase (family 10)